MAKPKGPEEHKKPASPPKLTRKELKRPDEFQARGLAALGYARSHARWLWSGVGILLVVAIGALILTQVRRSKAERAAFEVAKLFDEVRTQEASAEGLQPASRSRWQGLADRASGLSQQHAGTQAAHWAAILAGKCHLRAGQPAKAVEVLDPVSRKVRYPLFRALALELLGYARLESGDFQGSLQAFELIEEIDSPLKEIVPYYRGLVAERDGRTEDAGPAFESAETQSASSLFWGRKVREDILSRELPAMDEWLKALERPDE